MISGFGYECMSHLVYVRRDFAVRPNLTVPEVKAGYEGGLGQTIAWFKKTL